jgi:hypothetical protein
MWATNAAARTRPGGQYRPGARRRPGRCLGKRRAHQPYRAQHQDGSHTVDAPAGPLTAALAAAPRQDRHACRQGGQDNGQIDEEDPAPAQLDQQPAQHRATASGYRADARPYPDRGAPLM